MVLKTARSRSERHKKFAQAAVLGGDAADSDVMFKPKLPFITRELWQRWSTKGEEMGEVTKSHLQEYGQAGFDDHVPAMPWL